MGLFRDILGPFYGPLSRYSRSVLLTRDQRAFGSLARSLTNQACRALLEQIFFLFSEQTACTPDLAPLLLCISRGEDTQESVFKDSLGSHVREKRESLLVGDEEEERGRM